MEITVLLSNKILSMFLACIIGFITVKTKLLPSQGSEVISKILLYICTPCAMISSLQIEFNEKTSFGLLIAFCLAVFVHILFISVAKLFGKFFGLNKIERIAMVYSNAGYLIIPLVQSVLGPEYVFYTCGYCGVQLVLYWTHCVSLLGGQNKSDFKKILLNPCLISIYIGLFTFFTGLRLPSILASTMTDFTAVVGPLSMFVIGMVVSTVDLKAMFLNKKSYFICALRLLFLPLLTVGIFKLCTLFIHHEDLHTIMLIVLWSACAPIGATVVQMAQLFKQDYKYASQLNIISFFLCLLTMPFITYIFA